MGNIKLKVIYTTGMTLTLHKSSFQEAMKFVWQSTVFKKYEPLKIVFESTGKTLYADRQLFESFLKEEINLEELVELTQCENLYRNKTDFKTDNHLIIDAGSLWKEKNNELILVSDDDHITAPIVRELFEVIE